MSGLLKATCKSQGVHNDDLYLKGITQTNGKDRPHSPLAFLHEYIALRYRDLKERRDGAQPIALVKPFQTLGPDGP